MKIIDLPIDKIQEALWNPNRMDEAMLRRLKESLSRYGLVVPLVVRPTDNSNYETLSGNQRLKVIRELGFNQVPCVIVDLNHQEARLLAQALNSIKGEDDLARKGELFRTILSQIPEDKVLSILPETAESLKALSSIGQEDLAEHLRSWQQAQAARLKHLQFQLTNKQLKTVEDAINSILPQAKQFKADSPNIRGIALYLLCQYYLEHKGGV